MTRTELVVATAIILVAAFALGWLACWLVHRFIRVPGSETSELDRLAQELHAAEELRDQALAWMEHREAELTSQIAQTEAELRAAMDGLRHARAETERLREALEARG